MQRDRVVPHLASQISEELGSRTLAGIIGDLIDDLAGGCPKPQFRSATTAPMVSGPAPLLVQAARCDASSLSLSLRFRHLGVALKLLDCPRRHRARRFQPVDTERPAQMNPITNVAPPTYQARPQQSRCSPRSAQPPLPGAECTSAGILISNTEPPTKRPMLRSQDRLSLFSTSRPVRVGLPLRTRMGELVHDIDKDVGKDRGKFSDRHQ